MAWLNGRSTVSTKELGNTVANAFSFLQDAHARVVDRVYETQLRYEYYYCLDQNYRKDDNGYYKTVSGQTWYFKSFSDARVRMEYALTAAGEVVYAPVLFCPAPEMKNSTVVLQNAEGRTMIQPLNWQLSRDRGVDNYDADFTLLEEQGIVYLSILNFQPRCEADMVEFINSGKDLRDAKAIIFDLRSNGGGSGHYCAGWVKNFCGTEPSVPLAYAERFSPLSDAYHGKDNSRAYGTFRHRYEKGNVLKNDIPIIVLIDDKCGSAGESALHFLRSLENVLVVGSNSAGYQISSNSVGIYLPNSGLTAQFGTTFRFEFSAENVDYKGHEPDIWCNPAVAPDAVLNMLLRYDVADRSAWENLRAALAD